MPSIGPRPIVRFRVVGLTVAIALLAPTVPVLADDAEAGDPVAAALIAPVDVQAAFDPAVHAAMLRDHWLMEHPEAQD